jgi:hypothetical protein
MDIHEDIDGFPELHAIRERQAIRRLRGRRGLRGNLTNPKAVKRGRGMTSAAARNWKYFRMLKKLWRRPSDFFNDSKYPFLKFVGGLIFPSITKY